MNGDAFLEQFGNAAQYLRMSEEEKYKLMADTKADQGKKFVWVPKADTAYEKGLLKKVEDGTPAVPKFCPNHGQDQWGSTLLVHGVHR